MQISLKTSVCPQSKWLEITSAFRGRSKRYGKKKDRKSLKVLSKISVRSKNKNFVCP
jgi:hypothetical protein